MAEDGNTQEEAQAGTWLLHDDELTVDAVAEVCSAHGITLLPWSERESCPAQARVLLYVGDERTRDLAALAMERDWAVGVLPHPRAQRSAAALGVRGKLPALIEHYMRAPVIRVDALTCNDELVFSSVVIGRVLGLRPYDTERPPTRWSLFTGALRGLKGLGLKPYTLTTAKEQQVKMAALGLVAIGQTQSRLIARAFADETGVADGRLSLLALAPRSVFSYLLLLLRLLLPTKFDFSRLPASLSLVQTSRLHISAPKGTEYLVDGKSVHAEEIELAIIERGLRLLPGPALVLHDNEGTTVERERLKLNHAPVDDGARPLIEKPLPLFDHATADEYRDLFIALRENAAATSSYQMLMVLSVLLALGGMYANSAPVIIGAMILAPLMAPIISLAMGLARSDATLISSSGRTLLIGIAWGLGCAVLLAWAMPLEIPTQEMKARMSPTLLDLLVAVISGIAGAYANAKEEIAKSLAGVAIAVALVPPLSVVGIGLGWGDWAMAGGAALLLITNLAGIALAASATFLVLGFAPFHRARAGLGTTFFLVLLISLPLSLSFSHLVKRDRILENVPLGELVLSGLVVDVAQADVKLGEPHLVRLVLSAGEPVTTAHVEELKSVISRRLGEPIVLEVQSNLRR
ncbi:MAG: DUF389 domain-containing protein [Halioglobus sp.]|nr:DUF389 domain-containing protein [Halioglobus sp.]